LPGEEINLLLTKAISSARRTIQAGCRSCSYVQR
jgi:hypothetical protein